MNFPTRTALTILTIMGIVWVGAALFHFFPAQTADRLWAFHETRTKRPAAPDPLPVGKNFGKLAARTPAGRIQRPVAGVEPIWDAGDNLDAFYAALLRVETKENDARVRIAHYGDSPTTADLITADVRELLQRQFGDAGHGFYLADKPWAWYAHRDIESSASGWEPEAATTAKIRDGFYGYGGVSFRAGAGARARFRWRKAQHSDVEVGYFRQSPGGILRVEACASPLGEVNTEGEAGSGFAQFTLPAACRELSLVVTSGRVRLYGVQLRNSSPGLIYDSLGINGAYISVLSKFLNAGHWSEQLQHYAPDLVVINYGTNESVYAAFVDKVFEKELRESIRRVKAALPGKSILVMSPMDRGERGSSGMIETVPAIEKLVQIEEKVAAEEGVAFFNTFLAMGGNGTMREWYEGTPRLVGADFIHPMPGGAKRIGEYLYRAILDGYNHYKTRKLNSTVTAAAASSLSGQKNN